MLNRIITENKNKDRVIKLVQKFFSGFTLIEATGYWQGKPEKALIIEVDCKTDLEAIWLCEQIKLLNGQDCVLLQRIKAESELI